MKRLVPSILLVLAASAAFGDDVGGYRTEVIGAGPLAFSQPRCLRAAADGRVYLLEGRGEWVGGRILGADFASVKHFGTNGRPGEGPGRWFHPASLRPTADGDVLVADTGNRRVLLFDAEGRFKRVVVSEAAGSLEGPTDALALPGGDVLVCDSASSRVLLYDETGLLKRTIASPGTKADQVNHPFSLALDGDGEVWIVDTLNRRLLELGRSLSVKRVVRPTGPEGPLLRWPSYLDFDRDGNLLVADDGGSCILKLSGRGKLLKRIGLSDGEPRPFSRVSGVTVLKDGSILAPDSFRGCLFRFDAAGKLAGTIGIPGVPSGRENVVGFGVGRDGGFYEVTARRAALIRAYGPDGLLKTEFGGEGTAPGKFLRPRAATLAADGNLYVADSQNHNITVFAPDGILVRVFGRCGSGAGDMHYPRAVAVSHDGLVHVGDAGNRRVQVYRSTGEFVRTLARGVNPFLLDVDGDGNCAVYDDGEERVVVFDRAGRERWRMDVADMEAGPAMAFAADGKLWLLDRGTGRLRAVSADGKPSDLVRDDRLRGASALVREPGGDVVACFHQAMVRLGRGGEPARPVRAKLPARPGRLVRPAAVALVWDDELAVASEVTDAIQVFGRDGGFRRLLVTEPPVSVLGGLASDAAGRLYLLDSFEGRLYRVARDGRAEVAASGRLLRSVGAFAVGPGGELFVSNWEREGIVRLAADGSELGAIESGSGEEQFRWPRSFSVTPAGEVLVVEGHGGAIFCYGSDLKFKWKLDPREADARPRSRAAFSAVRADSRGRLFALPRRGEGVQVFGSDRKPHGSISLDAAAGVGLDRAGDLCIDTDGTLFIADTDNNRVVKLVPGD